jgi:hypothetical protein
MVAELPAVGLTADELIGRARMERLRAEATDERTARLARNGHLCGGRRAAGAAALTTFSSGRTLQ